MNTYTELEIGLHRRDEERYTVELRFTRPDSEAADMGKIATIQIDMAALRAQQLNSAEYGQTLTDMLFADQGLRDEFVNARSVTSTLDLPLRLRILIGPSAPELQSIRWETLRDPQSKQPLVMNERILFSRYLAAGDWRPIKLRPRAVLRALVVAANPEDLANYKLAAVDTVGEVERAKQGLGTIEVVSLVEKGTATLNGIIAKLREGFDILYLTAHGVIALGEPWIYLENEQNKAVRVAGSELVERMQQLEQRPRLVVLSSCQSAGQGQADATAKDNGALSALGPRLAEAGVPAVIGMQGNVMMSTVAAFMPVFFQELQKDGQLDRAMGVARSMVRDREDHWMPVLFMRLKSGRIWYVPGFGEGKQDFEKWPSLVDAIKTGNCTPILGTGLSESVWGSLREIASEWAAQYHFPLGPAEGERFPQVAHYLTITQSLGFLQDKLFNTLEERLISHFKGTLPANAAELGLGRLLAAAGEAQRKANSNDIYKVLASQRFVIYITVGMDNLLEAALEAEGKEPRSEFCRWNERIIDLPNVFIDEPNYEPNEKAPLVFHLFGIGAEPDSLVITVDDYFDYLIGVSQNKDLIPIPVRKAITDTGLLFLGFRLDDWDFRVLFRSIMNKQGGERRKKYAHIAGQILPEEGQFADPERARRYMETYFGGVSISIFWGSIEDFTRELLVQLASAPAAVPPPKRASRW